MWAGRNGAAGDNNGLSTLDAVTVTQTAVDDYSYLLEDGVVFTIDGDNVNMEVNGIDEAGFTLSETDAITVCPARTFKLKANQDPKYPANYYSTFFTSEGAYKVPEGAKAYIGALGKNGTDDVLKLAETELIHQSEAVILKTSQSDITLMPSCNKAAAATGNVLEGTDVEKKLSANQYALSLGQNGVGFYLWDGKPIGANKAYLTLSNTAGTKAFIFQFDVGETTGILKPVTEGKKDGPAYDLNGIRVNDNHKGIVIKNGKKVYQK